ncbi:MAG TPA: prolyl oligopeptidase family serine peptidase [Opitutales bacterium]|nr:prolyl oligopeptidase family serine peptidase [Opitutales bacterium]
MKSLFVWSALALGLAAWSGCSSIPAAPALTAQPAQDTYYGTTVTDPFRNLENVKTDAQVQAWFKAQAERTRAILDRIPGRQEIYDELLKYSNSAPVRITDVSEVPGRIFYEERKAGENQFKLYTRKGWSGPEQLLFDPDTHKGPDGAPVAINFYAPSPNGRYAAVGISRGGSENATIRVLETETGQDLGLAIERARFGFVAWKDDETGFYYNQLKERPADADPTLLYQDSQIRLHLLGTELAKDPVVFGTEALHGAEIGHEKIPMLMFQYGDPRVFGLVVDGVEREIGVYVSTQAAMDAGHPDWKKVFDTDDDIIDFAVQGDDLYALTHKDAPRFKLLRTKVDAPDFARAEVVIAPGEPVLESLSHAEDGLYVTMLDGGIERIQRLAFTPGAKPEEIALPLKGSVGDLTSNTRLPGIAMHLTSWVDVGGYYAYDPATGETIDTHLQPRGPYDQPGDLVAEQVRVPSYDGVLVPLTIIHKKEMKLNGENPCWLEAYGSYGIVDTAYFSPAYLPWFERGGIRAIAQVRGGGAFGEEWHLAGQKLNKPNTWKDLIACGQWLIDHHYTSTPKLGINGGSAGGITVGRAMTEAPNLFGAVVGDVGMFNPVRAETDSNGVPNISEFGSTTTPEGFKGLYEMDAYLHVHDGVKYPATLLTTGINDPRVPPWMPGKFAARLQQAGAPLVLLRVDYEAGHGIGSTRQQVLAELADTMAFFFWQFGQPGFQP